ncbi:hypothetical protein QMK19_41100 [Streptomyces sp. H10-C2]|uniref:hypothetical protein n=1 Tax=unclassified Streptomyces TaxID=2593676 RepID=UPI0024BB42A4|nr:MULTISPECIES: hypothetical protein [unclassified Streptomyces]MDJ0347608.1 hypothetical protein [Streptomyces sp. PH10-H1]MDJ0375795.1 hypothetical protein [Streptomyces sp. H10-C2]
MAIGDCVFCGSRVSSQGEHVLPRWFFERWDGQGPFTYYAGSKPIPKRSGSTQRDQLARVMLPVCGSNSPTDCNGWLNRTFEVAGKPQVETVLNDLRPIAGADVVAFARWVVKTLLLHAHPLAMNSEIGHLDTVSRSVLELPKSALPMMRNSGQFPEDLSLWMSVIDSDGAPADLPDFDQAVLPRVHRRDGAGGECRATTLGFSLPNHLMVSFQLVFHPLIDIVNPFESPGWATRLWPNPPADLDITAHPVLDVAGGRALTRWFVAGGPSIGLQPGERWPNGPTGQAFQAASQP